MASPACGCENPHKAPVGPGYGVTAFDFIPHKRLERYVGRKRVRGGSTIGDHTRSNPRHPVPWMYVERYDAASNREVFDTLWLDRNDDLVPCIPKKAGKVNKNACGMKSQQHVDEETLVYGQAFQWQTAWLMVINLAQCRKNDPELFEILRDVCRPTFPYHCVSATSEVNGEYILDQFDHATDLMMLVSDCGTSSSRASVASATPTFARSLRSKRSIKTRRVHGGGDEDAPCGFLVLGFIYLDSKHDVPLLQSSRLACHGIHSGQALSSVRRVYIDIVCSRFKVGSLLLNEVIKGSNRPWMDVVFGRGGQGPFLLVLRAISPVYTFYPLAFGFTRTSDAVTLYPIFYVDVADIKRHSKTKLADTPEQIMTSIFGPRETSDGQVVWTLPPRCKKYRVYRLMAPFKQWLRNAPNREEMMENAVIFKEDSDVNGYFYGLLVR